MNIVFGAIEQFQRAMTKIIIKFIRGSRAQDVSQHKSKPFYGAGKEFDENFWEELISNLIVDGWITKKGDRFVTPAGFRQTGFLKTRDFILSTFRLNISRVLLMNFIH